MAPPDANTLAERLQGLAIDEYWLHLEAASRLEKYPAKHHAHRVRDKLDVAEGLIYLPGQPARSNEDSDMPAPFRQRRYFYYLSGCNEPNCFLTYDIQHDILALFIPRINPERVIWNGRGSTPAEALDKYDIDEVHFIDELDASLRDWFQRYRGNLYILHDTQAPKSPYFNPRIDAASLQSAMNQTRMIKDEHEIKLIRKANDISSEAHKQVLANIVKFRNEAQVEGLFLNVCISKQAKQQAYDPIAASGLNAGTLHYDANNEDFENRQLMCLDAGCEYELYASDITRTFPLSGSWPSKEAENVYKLVQRMQDTCISRLAPGVRYLDLHILAHHIAIDGLLKLGVLHNGTREEIYKAGTSRAFFPHGLGHHVGLEVHDVGQQELMSMQYPKLESAPSLYPENFHLPVYDAGMCLAPTNPQSPHLEEGMVVTVEPGIYFSAYALNYFYLPSPVHSRYINTDVLYRYLPVGGVRIEDDILITSKGYENLTTAPKGDAMLEIIRSQNAMWPFVADSVNVRHVHCPSTLANVRVVEEPLLRAPGIAKRVSKADLGSLSRASTAPVKSLDDRNSVDCEPFKGPSLFSGFSQSTAKNESIYTSKSFPSKPSRSRMQQERHLPLCGNASDQYTHVFMVSQDTQGVAPNVAGSVERPRPTCKKCTVLSQTMERLRTTLNQSEEKSLELDSALHTRTERRSTEQSPETRRSREPSTVRSWGPRCNLPSQHNAVHSRPLFPLSSEYHKSLRKGFQFNSNEQVSPSPMDMLQRRSVTFDSCPRHSIPHEQPVNDHRPYPEIHGTVPPQRENHISTNTESAQGIEPGLQATPFAHSWAQSSNPPLPRYYTLPDSKSTQETALRDYHIASQDLPVAFDLEQKIHHERDASFSSYTSMPASRPYLPNLRSNHSSNVPYVPSAIPNASVTAQSFPKEPVSRKYKVMNSAEHGALPQTHTQTRARYQNAPLGARPSICHEFTSAPQPVPSRAPTVPQQNHKIEELRKAMDELWRMREDVERTFGMASRGDDTGAGTGE